MRFVMRTAMVVTKIALVILMVVCSLIQAQKRLRATGSGISGETLPTSPRDGVLIGFLDDKREELVNWEPGPASERVIRPAFEKTSSEWRQVDVSSLSARNRWTIAFDGKNLGQVESQPDKTGGLTQFETILASPSTLPEVGVSSERFAGILVNGPGKVRRPLVAVSKPYFRDPDEWKRAKLPTETSALIRAAFRRDYPHVDRCKEETIAERDWTFPDSALNLPVVYASNKHSFLVEAVLNAGECGWVDEPDDPESAPWFFVSSGGEVRRIGSFMELLDAGDYDNDGLSEVIFFLSQGENTDGFVLYYDTFKKSVNFSWHYH